MNIQNYMEQYNELDDKEKIRRLEWIAQCYAAYGAFIGGEKDWKEAPFLDATKCWDDFQESLDEFTGEIE